MAAGYASDTYRRCGEYSDPVCLLMHPNAGPCKLHNVAETGLDATQNEHGRGSCDDEVPLGNESTTTNSKHTYSVD